MRKIKNAKLITFDDLPGWYAVEVSDGYVIYDNAWPMLSAGFYSRRKKTLTITSLFEQSQHKCQNLHQAMRLNYLLGLEPLTKAKPATT